MDLRGFVSGAEGDRTPNLLIANQALSQLSYGPNELTARHTFEEFRFRNGLRNNKIIFRPSNFFRLIIFGRDHSQVTTMRGVNNPNWYQVDTIVFGAEDGKEVHFALVIRNSALPTRLPFRSPQPMRTKKNRPAKKSAGFALDSRERSVLLLDHQIIRSDINAGCQNHFARHRQSGQYFCLRDSANPVGIVIRIIPRHPLWC
jgi:hypothetical protein